MKTPALVLDGHLKGALCAVRVLGKAGVRVMAGAERSSAPALHSRYTKKRLVYPAPDKLQANFIEAVKNFAETQFNLTGEKLIVYTFSDATFLSLYKAREELQKWCIFSIPDTDSIKTAFSKRLTSQLGLDLGIPTIKTYDLEDRHSMLYPVVVKNDHSIVWRDDKGVAGSAVFVFSPEELNEKFNLIAADTGEEPLVQEFIVGDEYGVEILGDRGEVLLEFTHKRIRSLSPRGGAAVVKETAMATPETDLMQKYAREIVAKLKWTGPIMVEFKLDNRDGGVRLMEINGRFWGSLPLPQRAGVDFVGGYYSLLSKGRVAKAPRTILHVRTYHFAGDCKWLSTVLFKKDPLREKLYPTRRQALLDFALEGIKGKSDVFSVADPMPSWWEVIDILKR